MLFIVLFTSFIVVAAIFDLFGSDDSRYEENETTAPQTGLGYLPYGNFFPSQTPLLSPDRQYIWTGQRWVRYNHTGKGIAVGVVIGIALAFLLYTWFA